jgi:hypothetical protein
MLPNLKNYLSQESGYLIHYFQKHLLEKDKKESTSSNHKKTVQLFTEIWYNLKEIEHSLKEKKELYHFQIKKINTVTQIPKPRNFNSKGFPEKIRRHIEETSVYQLEYRFSLLGRNITVHFVLEEPNLDVSMDVFSEYIEKMIVWLTLIDKYASKRCSRNLTIYIYLTSLVKMLPSSTIDIIDENHANTAFTYTCLPVSEIVIFRKEEWFKVFLHETFHNFGLDFSGMNNDYCREKILSLFPVNSEVNLYEAYTEFWAETMNCLLSSFFLNENNNKNKNDLNAFLSVSFQLLDLERTFSFFQMVKVLDFMGLLYQDLYTKSGQSQIKRTAFYKENTSILAYYVLTTVLMNNYEDFIVWCDRHHFSLFDFKKTISHQREFCDYIADHYKTKSFLERTRSMENQLKKVKKAKTSTGLLFLKNNMRMTVLEPISNVR